MLATEHLLKPEIILRHRRASSATDSQELGRKTRQNSDADARMKAAAWAWYQRSNVEFTDLTRRFTTVALSCAPPRKQTSAAASRFKGEAIAQEEERRGKTRWDCGSSLYDLAELQWILQRFDGTLERQVMEHHHTRSFSMPHACFDSPLKGGKSTYQRLEEHGDQLSDGDESLEEQNRLDNYRLRCRSMSDYYSVKFLSRNHPNLNMEAKGIKKICAEGKYKPKKLRLRRPLHLIAKGLKKISRVMRNAVPSHNELLHNMIRGTSRKKRIFILTKKREKDLEIQCILKRVDGTLERQVMEHHT